MELEKAMKMGEKVMKKFEGMFKPNKLQFAGSIRRGKPVVKDIEIIGELMKPHSVFLNELDRILERLKLSNRISFEKNGPRYKKFWLLSNKNPQNGTKTDLSFQVISVDLFLVYPPSQWGPQLLIRTGPESFSKWLVTVKKPKGFRFTKGHVEYKDPKDKEAEWHVIHELSTEESVFKELNLNFVPLTQRDEY